jgi:hypothetical protein
MQKWSLQFLTHNELRSHLGSGRINLGSSRLLTESSSQQPNPCAWFYEQDNEDVQAMADVEPCCMNIDL